MPKIKTTDGALDIEIIGQRPVNTPYLRIGSNDGDCLDSIDEAGMAKLVCQIIRALGD